MIRPALLLLLALTACAAPDVVKTPVKVSIPVEVPCRITPPPAPTLATASITPQSTMFEKARALAASSEMRKGYEAALVAAVKACQ